MPERALGGANTSAGADRGRQGATRARHDCRTVRTRDVRAIPRRLRNLMLVSASAARLATAVAMRAAHRLNVNVNYIIES
jgi:hypothetical protein